MLSGLFIVSRESCPVPASRTSTKPHDVGGRPAGPVAFDERANTWWEWQIDAMVRLALKKGLFTDFAELRDGIERLDPADYETLSYYERWAKSLATTLVDKGIVSADDLEQRVAEIARRQADDD